MRMLAAAKSAARSPASLVDTGEDDVVAAAAAAVAAELLHPAEGPVEGSSSGFHGSVSEGSGVGTWRCCCDWERLRGDEDVAGL